MGQYMMMSNQIQDGKDDYGEEQLDLQVKAHLLAWLLQLVRKHAGEINADLDLQEGYAQSIRKD